MCLLTTVISIVHMVAPWSIYSLYEKDVRGAYCVCPARQANTKRKRCLYQHLLTHPQPSGKHKKHRWPSPSLLLLRAGVCSYNMACDVWVAAAAVGLLSLSRSQCSCPAPVAGTSVHEAWRFVAHSSCWHSDLLFLSSIIHTLVFVHTYLDTQGECSQQSDFLRPEDRLWCSSIELNQTSCWPDTFTLNHPLLPLFHLFFPTLVPLQSTLITPFPHLWSFH